MNWLFKRLNQSSGHADHRGTLVGYSDQKRSVPVYLSQAALRGHILLVGKGHTGKTSLMAHLAKSAMRSDSALIVIDVEGDLLPILRTQVSPNRADDVSWIDFGNPTQVPGLNVLDQNQGIDIDTIVSNLLHTAEVSWHDYWGSGAEDMFRMALRTLWSANRALAQRNEPQFTLMDIPYLFGSPVFRRRLLNTLVHDPSLPHWWFNHYEAMHSAMQIDSVYPLLTLIDRLATNRQAKNILGQSSSTFNLREMLRPGSIVLVNLCGAFPDLDLSNWLGALIADRINMAVLARKRMPEAQRPPPMTIAIHGMQPIPRVEHPGYLSELQKLGARYILTRLTLGFPKSDQASVSATILSGITNLFVFRTTGFDAETISEELNDAALFSGIMWLPDHKCFVKTREDAGGSPIKKIQTLPPFASDSLVPTEVMSRMNLFNRPVDQVTSAREAFEQQWYGRELALYRDMMSREPRQAKIPPGQAREP